MAAVLSLGYSIYSQHTVVTSQQQADSLRQHDVAQENNAAPLLSDPLATHPIDNPTVVPVDESPTGSSDPRFSGSTENQQAQHIVTAQEHRNAYIRRYISRPTTPTALAVHVVEGEKTNYTFGRELANSVERSTTPNFMTDIAIDDGVFDRVFARNLDEINQLDLQLVSNHLLVAKLHLNFDANQTIRGTIRANARIDVRLIEASTGALADGFEIESSVLGHSQSLAKQLAYDDLIEKVLVSLEK